MNPESLTVHALAVKRSADLNINKDKYTFVSCDEASQMVDVAQKYGETMNMHPYYVYRQKNIIGNLENIGYSKSGFEGIYNIQIMGDKQSIIAFGAGAVTKIIYPCEDRIERIFNVKTVEEYIRRVDEMIDRKMSGFLL